MKKPISEGKAIALQYLTAAKEITEELGLPEQIAQASTVPIAEMVERACSDPAHDAERFATSLVRGLEKTLGADLDGDGVVWNDDNDGDPSGEDEPSGEDGPSDEGEPSNEGEPSDEGDSGNPGTPGEEGGDDAGAGGSAETADVP